MKKHLLFCSIGAIALLLSSCATMFSGTTQKVTFNSEPQGARVEVNGLKTCVTPCTADIKRSSSSMVMFTKDGYTDSQNTLKGSFNATTLLSLFLLTGALLAIPADYMSGAAWRYKKPNVYATLSPKTGYVPPSTTQAKLSSSTPVRRSTAATGGELKVAVFDPTGSDVSFDIKTIVREEVSSAIVNTPGYTVLEREQIDKVLAENKFQATGQVDDKQIGALGRKMGANKVCVISISKLGSAYHISCKLVDVATARIDSQKTGRTVAGGGDIDKVIADIAAMILQ
jgi:hypothetical protein